MLVGKRRYPPPVIPEKDHIKVGWDHSLERGASNRSDIGMF